jgi:hypothetical protein
MTPKEKAEELVDKMCYISIYDDKEDYNPAMAWERGKQCALIAVDEMISVLTDFNGIYNITPALTYWQEVKQEIENL